MQPVTVDPRRATPPSQQLVEALLDRIAGGVLGVDDRLPSVRVLAAEVLVNPNTVGKAYRELEALGVVQGRSGSGVYVTRRGPRIAEALRQAATRDAFVRAYEAACAAGHRTDDLLALLAATPQPAGGETT